MCAPLCEAVTGCRDAALMLDRIVALNLFVFATDDRSPARAAPAGPVAVAGFRQVLEAMMDDERRRQYEALAGRGG